MADDNLSQEGQTEIRDTILRYQNECDDVLWQYWMEGQVTRKTESSQLQPPKLTYATKEQRKPLVIIAAML